MFFSCTSFQPLNYARVAFKAGQIVKYYTRKEHVLVIFAENATGIKVSTKNELLQLLDKFAAEGIPEVFLTPREQAGTLGDMGVPGKPVDSKAVGIDEIDFNTLCSMDVDTMSKNMLLMPELDQFLAKSVQLCAKLKNLKEKSVAKDDEGKAG